LSTRQRQGYQAGRVIRACHHGDDKRHLKFLRAIQPPNAPLAD